MAPTNRYMLRIIMEDEVRAKLGGKYNLCCAWGFSMAKDSETKYNVIGWSHEVSYENTIRWAEEYRIAATSDGWMPQKFVDANTRKLPIALGQQLILDTMDKYRIADPGEGASTDGFNFQVNAESSIIMYKEMDKTESDDGMAAVFMASQGKDPLTPPTTGVIKPARKLLICLPLLDYKLSQNKAFDSHALSVPAIEYDYGAQATHYVEVTLGLSGSSIIMRQPPKVYKHEYGERNEFVNGV